MSWLRSSDSGLMIRGEGEPVSERDILSDRLHTTEQMLSINRRRLNKAEKKLSICRQALERIATAGFPKGPNYQQELDKRHLEIILLATHTLNTVEADES